MKKTWILLIWIGICFPVYGQIPFISESSVWTVKHTETDVWQGGVSTEYFDYTFGKDTVLLEETWKILLQDDKPVGAFQENGEKIYYYSFNWPEEIASEKRLFYDFSKSPGDTVYYCNLYEYETGYLFESRQEAEATDPYYDFEIVNSIDTVCQRKVFYLGYGTEWIEGIGSTESFFGRFHPIPAGYTIPSYTLHEMICDSTIVYTHGRLTDPDYRPMYLKEGLTWYVRNADQTDSYFRYHLGAPTDYNGWKTFPVDWDGKYMGYVYDQNQQIIWETPYDCGIHLYDFSLKKGDKAWIYDKIELGPHTRPQASVYTVSEVDSIVCEGQKRKRIRLDGPVPQDWIEGIGSTKGFLYSSVIIEFGEQYNRFMNPDNELTCCYVGEEPLYHNPRYKDCTETSIEETGQPSGLYEVRGNRLILHNVQACTLELYRMSGELIYRETLPGGNSTVSLEGLPELLIGKLSGTDGKTVSLKLIR